MRRVAAVGALALPLALGAGPQGRDWLADARARAAEEDWAGTAELLREALQRSAGGPEVDALLGEAYLELGRPDEAAHHLDRAAGATADDREARRLRKLLRTADPLASRRAGFLEKVAKTLHRSAAELFEDGHAERALDLLVRIEPIAEGERLAEVRALLERIRDTRRAVDLDAASADRRAPGEWPLLEVETEHYLLSANLEPEVAELVGDVMDDIFASYVEIYFGGDGDRAASRKATIRIHGTSAEMLANWEGENAPGGWWSPGEWKVVCYDTRTSTGSLDAMLETLFHEASHQFMTMRSKGGFAPSWLNEGTASFFEGAKAMADHRVLWPQAAWGRLLSLNWQLGQADSPRLADVIGWSEPGSYDPPYYPYGWGLVYFFQQYEDPATLAYVYRPLYLDYMERITTRGGDPRALFDETFLGDASPHGWATLDEFEAGWSAWIRETVHPLYVGEDRRERRMERVRAYLAAAEEAGGRRRGKRGKGDAASPPGADELRLRALGDVEFVRTEFEDDEVTAELLAIQADLLEQLDREESAAPVLEDLLDRADAGEVELTEDEYAAYEERLYRLDRRNAELRAVRGRSQRFARGAAKLVEDYAEEGYLLRRYTLARVAGLALDDARGLLPVSVALREEARAAGLLLGSIEDVAGASAQWVTIFDDGDPAALETGPGRATIEGVRPTARICTAVPVRGEYEVRATLGRAGRVRRGTVQGLVVSGTVDGDWVVVGFDGRGRMSLRRMDFGEGGGVTDRPFEVVDPEPPLARGAESVRLAVHAFPEGRLEIAVDDRAPVAIDLAEPLPATGYVGVYAKDGRTELTDLVVEVYP